MDSLVKPLERVIEGSEWFVRTPSLRVLHVVTNGLLRNVVLKHLTASELLEANTSPFFVLEASTDAADDGWALRTDELRADWEALRGAPSGGSEVAPLWPEEQANIPLARFALELGRALSRLPPRATGLVIVLAPVWVRDVPRWRKDLLTLFQVKELVRARFVVVDLDEACSAPVIEKLGPLADRIDALIDEGVLRREVNASLDAMKSAPSGASGFQLVGAAGPAVAPPDRSRRTPLSPTQRAEMAQQVGISPVMFDPDAMRGLRVLILGAAASMRDGEANEAVRLQREARDFCVSHGLSREAVVNELVLAGYVLQARQPERALDIFRDGRKRAEEAHLMDMAVQAQMAVGACLLLMKRPDDAAAAYAEGGKLGSNNKAPILAIECYRMCGQLLASRGQLQQATTAFRRAIETAEVAGPEVKKGSTFVEAARGLAVLCRKHGLIQQAESLEAQAAATEESKESSASEPPPS